jgi:hypothetical protein
MFETFIVISVEAIIGRVATRGYFRHARWLVDNLNNDIDYLALVDIYIILIPISGAFQPM